MPQTPVLNLPRAGRGGDAPPDQWAALRITSSSTQQLPPAPNYKTTFQERDTALPPLFTPLLWWNQELCQVSGAGWCLGWTIPKSCLYVCTWVLWINTYSYLFLLACSPYSSFFLHLTAVVLCWVQVHWTVTFFCVLFAQHLSWWSPSLEETGGKRGSCGLTSWKLSLFLFFFLGVGALGSTIREGLTPAPTKSY